MYHLDHLLWEAFNLPESEAHFTELTGVTPAYGGTHPSTGTHNSLLGLGESAYLEIIAPNPDLPQWKDLPRNMPAGFTPGLIGFAMQTPDINATYAQLQATGSEVRRHSFSRKLPGGSTLTWQSVVLPQSPFGRCTPFFVQLEGGPHPSETAPRGCELLSLTAGYPKPEALTQFYIRLKLNIPIYAAERAELTAIVQTPKGKITLVTARRE
jgi:hypothetical protein